MRLPLSLFIQLLAFHSLASPSLLVGASPVDGSVEGGQLERRLRLGKRDDVVGLQGGSRLTQAQVNGIEGLLNRTATKSWEIGVHLQSLLEFSYPSLSPFSSTSSPWSSPSPSVSVTPFPTDLILRVSSILAQKPTSQLQLIQDGSAADPASVGGAVWLAAELTADGGRLLSNSSGSGGATKEEAEQAVEGQIEALFSRTPRAGNDAISHRVEDVELWSDFVYMVPPFFAYVGALTGNSTLLQASYDQARLYRQYLRDNATGVWTHIYVPGGGMDEDDGLWATGNGWAASGMLRVVASMQNAGNGSIATAFASQSDDLARWTSEIVEGVWKMPMKNGLLYNYLNQTSSSFLDAAGTALLVASTYRLAQLTSQFSSLSSSNSTPSSLALNAAEGAYQTLTSPSHLSSTGVLSPVVNPLSYGKQLGNGGTSPEGEAFVLLMESARRDYLAMGGKAGVVTNVTSGAAGPSCWRSGVVGWAAVGLAAAVVVL